MPHLRKPFPWIPLVAFSHFFRVAAMVWSPIRAAICKGLVPSSPAAVAGTPRLLSTSAECVPQGGIWNAATFGISHAVSVITYWHLSLENLRLQVFSILQLRPKWVYATSTIKTQNHTVSGGRNAASTSENRVLTCEHRACHVPQAKQQTFMIDTHRIPRSTVKQPFANEHHLCWTGASQALQSNRIHKASNLQAI